MSNRLPCKYCGGYGFVIGFDNDPHKCPRCEGYCDDPAFEAGRQYGVVEERERCAKICENFSLSMRKMARESVESRGEKDNAIAASLDAQALAGGLLTRMIRGEK